MTTRKENTKIKRALQKEFPNNWEISVRQDRGTAAGWKNITIKPTIKEEYRPDGMGYVREVSDKVQEIRNKAQKIADQNADLYTYYRDDGYGTKGKCVTVTVELIE